MTAAGNDKDQIQWFAIRWLSEHLKREVGADANLAALGLDSLDIVRFTDALADKLGIDELPVATVLEQSSIGALAAHLSTLSPT